MISPLALLLAAAPFSAWAEILKNYRPTDWEAAEDAAMEYAADGKTILFLSSE